MPIAIAQRVVIKFLTNENVGPNEIWHRVRIQYGESTLSKMQVKFWHKEFRGGRDAVQTQVINDAQGQASPQRIL